MAGCGSRSCSRQDRYWHRRLFLRRVLSKGPEPGQPWDVWYENLIGEFDVKDGFIVKRSYRRNPTHRVLSSIGQGFMQLEEELMRCLIEECNELPEPEEDFIAGEFGHIQ